MKKNYKILIKKSLIQLFIVASLLLVVYGGIEVMRAQQIREPDNPVQQMIDRSHDLSGDTMDIQVDQNTYDKITASMPLIQNTDTDQLDNTGNADGTADSLDTATTQDAAGNSTDANGSSTGGSSTDANTEAGNAEGGGGDNGTDGVEETDLTYFTTSIADGETVSDPNYAFSITHLNKKLTVTGIYVYLNGRLNLLFSGSVQLAEGRNSIRVSVTYEDSLGKTIHVYKLYTVYYDKNAKDEEKPPEDVVEAEDITITTSMVDQETSSTRTYQFTAVAKDTAGKTYSVTAVVNGKTITEHSGDTYTAYLDKKKNTIRLRVSLKDGKKAEKTYTVYYIPETTVDTQPKLVVNIQDGMTSKSPGYTLDVEASDYQDNRIYYNKLTVTLNGTALYYNWATDTTTSYWLEFTPGENLVTIRAEDEAGRYIENVYHITYTPEDAYTPIGVIQISVEASTLGLGTLGSATDVPIYAGEKFSYYFADLMEANGYSYTNGGTLDEGFYLRAIKKDGIAAGYSIPEDLRAQIDIDGLMWTGNEDPNQIGEFDYTQASGWMISVNGSYYGYGYSDYYPKDGDVVRIRYTLANGKDIGGFRATGTSDGNINSNYGKEW